MVKSIPLNKLVQSPRNVRRHVDPAADAELKASIAARGLLQNLIVRPTAKGKFEVESGERRRRAMLALAEEKLLARDHGVTRLVLEESAEAAVETSLAENFHRLAMNPADEAQALAALVSGGATVEDVARRFGVTVRFVEGRLRLATLDPRLAGTPFDHAARVCSGRPDHRIRSQRCTCKQRACRAQVRSRRTLARR